MTGSQSPPEKTENDELGALGRFTRMGLDTVELVMAVEEEFGLQIPDSEAGKMERVGDMFRFVLQTLRERGESIDEDVIWTRLRDVIIAQLGVRPEEVIPTARFIQDFRID